MNKITLSDVCSEMNFGTFYATYYARFIRYAYYYMNDSSTSEDIVHDALLYFWENRRSIPRDTDVIGYILLTVENKCLNYLKHLSVEQEFSKHCTNLQEWEIATRIQTLEDDSYDAIFLEDVQRILKQALVKLPDKTREIFVLNRLKNKSRKEIASILGVSLQKVDYHINKAINLLSYELKDYLPLMIFLLYDY